MSYLEFHRIIIAGVISMARLGGVFMICPVFTDAMIPGLLRRVVVFALAFVVFPMVYNQMPPGEPDTLNVSIIAIREVALGFVIGFFSAMPFWLTENVGNFIDNQRGATMGEVFSPMNGSQVSTMGLYLSQIIATLFFVSGAVFVLLSAVYASYSIWPVFGGKLFTMSPETPNYILGAVDNMLMRMLIISSPIILIMFLATLGLGFVNRTAPQLNVFFLSMPVKSVLGLSFMVIYLPFILDMLMYTETEAILGPVRKIFI